MSASGYWPRGSRRRLPSARLVAARLVADRLHAPWWTSDPQRGERHDQELNLLPVTAGLASMAARSSAALADFPLVVGCDYIPRIQEVQASIYHVLRDML